MRKLTVSGWSCVVLLVGCGAGGDSTDDNSGGSAGTAGRSASTSAGSGGSAGLSGSAGSTLGAAGIAGTSTSDASDGRAGPDDGGGAAGSAGALGMDGAIGNTAGAMKIFDGTTLDGWTSTPAGMFTVMNGTLVASGKGRGAFATNAKYTHFRVLFSVHPGGTGGHAPTVLVFCNYPDKDALGGIQFQPPNGGHWDYRPGKNNDGGALFTKIGPPGAPVNGWTSCEIVANAATGEAKMACGGVDVLHFKDPTAGMAMAAPFAIQTHNAGITDGYKDLSIEDNIANDNYVSVK